jgi:hypothetical protein
VERHYIIPVVSKIETNIKRPYDIVISQAGNHGANPGNIDPYFATLNEIPSPEPVNIHSAADLPPGVIPAVLLNLIIARRYSK